MNFTSHGFLDRRSADATGSFGFSFPATGCSIPRLGRLTGGSGRLPGRLPGASDRRSSAFARLFGASAGLYGASAYPSGVSTCLSRASAPPSGRLEQPRICVAADVEPCLAKAPVPIEPHREIHHA
jgi:hypothetical protein